MICRGGQQGSTGVSRYADLVNYVGEVTYFFCFVVQVQRGTGWLWFFAHGDVVQEWRNASDVCEEQTGLDWKTEFNNQSSLTALQMRQTLSRRGVSGSFRETGRLRKIWKTSEKTKEKHTGKLLLIRFFFLFNLNLYILVSLSLGDSLTREP